MTTQFEDLEKKILNIIEDDKKDEEIEYPPGLYINPNLLSKNKIATNSVNNLKISPILINQILHDVNQKLIIFILKNNGLIFGTYVMNQLYNNIIGENLKFKIKTIFDYPEYSYRHLELRKIDVLVPYTYLDIIIQNIKKIYTNTYECSYPNIVNTNLSSNSLNIKNEYYYRHIELTICPFEEFYNYNLPVYFKPPCIIINILSPIQVNLNIPVKLDIPENFIQFENEGILYNGTDYFVSSLIIPHDEYYLSRNTTFIKSMKYFIEQRILIVMEIYDLNYITEALNSGFTIIYNYKKQTESTYSLYKMRKIISPIFCYGCGGIVINNFICEMNCCNIGYHPQCLYKILLNCENIPLDTITCISCHKVYPDSTLSFNSLKKFLT